MSTRPPRAEEVAPRAAPGTGLEALFAPRAVAVVGASRRPGSIGGALLANICEGGFRGSLFAVHPEAAEIGGVPAYPSVGTIPARVDLALIVTPAAAVEAAVRDCAEAGVRAVVVISAGFAEVSPEGAVTQARIRDLARGAGMRLVGPNCMGVVNTDPAVRLIATFAPVSARPGNVGVLSQSGALGAAVLDHAHALGLGVSTFVSVGNKADVSGNDLLAYWKDDPRTEVIALYLESFGNPRRFARLAPEVARRKPIVAVVSDPHLGPLVVAGLGGREVELMRDASFRLAPVTDLDAAEMIDGLRMRPLLDGYRSSPPADRAALVDLVGRVSALADAAPELHELDLNPVKVLAAGEGVTVVDARILAVPGAPIALSAPDRAAAR